MKKTMIELWRGEGIASRESEDCHKEVMRLVGELCRCEELLRTRLQGEDWDRLEHMQDVNSQIASLEKEDAFIRGLTMGIRITAEAFEE